MLRFIRVAVKELKMEAHYREVAQTQLTQQQFNKILCPNLRIGVRMSLLNPDADGWVGEGELRAFMEYIGVRKKSQVENLLIALGRNAPEQKRDGYVNLTLFQGTFLDHGSSSAILNNPNGYSDVRMALFKSYADDRGRIYLDDLCLAQNEFNLCPFNFKSFKGTSIQSFEMSALFHLYGQKDQVSGKEYFSLEDIEDIWYHNRFPQSWRAPETSNYGTFPALMRFIAMMFRRCRLGWDNTGSRKKNSA